MELVIPSKRNAVCCCSLFCKTQLIQIMVQIKHLITDELLFWATGVEATGFHCITLCRPQTLSIWKRALVAVLAFVFPVRVTCVGIEGFDLPYCAYTQKILEVNEIWSRMVIGSLTWGIVQRGCNKEGECWKVNTSIVAILIAAVAVRIGLSGDA